MKKFKLIAPDKKHCQAMVVRGGCYPTAEHFMRLGGHGKLVQCKVKPIVIAYENKAAEDRRKGSMSLCASCLKVFKTRFPENFATFKPLSAVQR